MQEGEERLAVPVLRVLLRSGRLIGKVSKTWIGNAVARSSELLYAEYSTGKNKQFCSYMYW